MLKKGCLRDTEFVHLRDVKTTGDVFVVGLVGEDIRSTVSDCSSSGQVTGDRAVGGLIGFNDGTVCGSDAKGSASGTTNVGDLVGDGNPAQATC